ncbi:hypothetical protein FC88_GL000173 [Companilactobacillus futsaii JCM 17355]|uniref:TcdA-E operon negative regulator n=1 Tax=Companilactobacillus futsaii JCM 17355 TaxID=1423818 RepID=A0ABR5P607_9LACO|nr:hypothetical protein [Companilactobacillus futsaii]KRK93641.1 hypothetical protein FC88_GL000173 [Companilactobacillus futsaii JCM 17355]
MNAVGIICILFVIIFFEQNNGNKNSNSSHVRNSKIQKKKDNKVESKKKHPKIKKKKKVEKSTPEQEAEKIENKFVASDYDSPITYENLARTPKEYTGKKVKFAGEVVQVIEDDKMTELRVAVNNDHDTIVYCIVPTSILHDTHILEDDSVIIYGISAGLKSYESTMGGQITIPSLVINHVDDNGKSTY